jgi:hypothetical protein
MKRALIAFAITLCLVFLPLETVEAKQDGVINTLNKIGESVYFSFADFLEGIWERGPFVSGLIYGTMFGFFMGLIGFALGLIFPPLIGWIIYVPIGLLLGFFQGFLVGFNHSNRYKSSKELLRKEIERAVEKEMTESG